MEVIETMGNDEDGAAIKTIRLLVTSDGGEPVKFRKVEGSASEPLANILVCQQRGNSISGDSVLHDSGDMIFPIGNVSEKKNTSSSVRIINISNPAKISSLHCPSEKKQVKRPIITVLQTRPSSSPPSVQLAKPVTSMVTVKSKERSSPEIPQIRLQSKSDTVSKILVSTDSPTKLQTVSGSTRTVKTSVVSDMQEKGHCTSFLEEQLPLLAEVSDKSIAQSSSNGNCQTVMMRVNSLGELELDPMFLSTDALSELEVEESSSGKRTELIVADEEDSLAFSPSKTQGEGGNANVNQNWFTSREDKEMFKWRGHAWRQGMWSKEETEVLQKNIRDYCMERNVTEPGSVIFKMSKEERSGFYRIIAKGLNRPLFSIYRRVIRLYDNRNHIGKYTTEEVNRLRELRMKHGNNWQAIAALLGRSPASVKDRCRLLNEHCNRGAWTVEEEDRLAMAVYDLASAFPGEQVTSGISWGEVSARVKTRSEKQCRTKWLNYLNWKRTSGVEWSKADDIQLICRLSVCGVEEESQVDWSVLARGWPACRSPHWLRGKWWNLKKRLPRSLENGALGEMCQQLYNMQPLHFLQSTLVELPTAGPNSTASVSSGSIEDKSAASSENNLSAGSVKLCIPAANFANIINSENRDDDFASMLSALVQTALVMPSGDVITSDQPVTSLVTQPTSFASPVFSSASLNPQLSSSLTRHLTSTLTSCGKSRAIVVEHLEDSMIHLSEVANDGVDRDALLEQAELGVVKEEDILSDSEGTNARTSLASSLDPSSPAVTSKVILNDPILSVSGEPLGREEGLQQDHDDTDLAIV